MVQNFSWVPLVRHRIFLELAIHPFEAKFWGWLRHRQWLEPVIEKFEAEGGQPLVGWSSIDVISQRYTVPKLFWLPSERRFRILSKNLLLCDNRSARPAAARGHWRWISFRWHIVSFGSSESSKGKRGHGNGTHRGPISFVTALSTSLEWATIFKWRDCTCLHQRRNCKARLGSRTNVGISKSECRWQVAKIVSSVGKAWGLGSCWGPSGRTRFMSTP